MNSYDTKYMLLKEQKLKQIINKQKTVTDVADDLSVSRQSIHKWLSRYKRFGIDGLISGVDPKILTPILYNLLI